MEVSGQLHAPAPYSRGKSRRCPLNRRLGGPQSRSERSGEEKKSHPYPSQELNPGCSARSLVFILTEIPRLRIFSKWDVIYLSDLEAPLLRMAQQYYRNTNIYCCKTNSIIGITFRIVTIYVSLYFDKYSSRCDSDILVNTFRLCMTPASYVNISQWELFQNSVLRKAKQSEGPHTEYTLCILGEGKSVPVLN
jgi:hypothetical protein